MRTLYFCPVLSSILCLLLFFLAYSQPSQIGCLPYFHIWCGLSANLGCRLVGWLVGWSLTSLFSTNMGISETKDACLKRAARGSVKIQDATNRQIFTICAPSRTIAQLCRALSSQLRHVSTIGKKLVKQQCLPHDTVNFGPLAAEICWRVWGTPANFNGFWVLAALLHGTLVVGVSQTLRR